jgi:hypothetical protein
MTYVLNLQPILHKIKCHCEQKKKIFILQNLQVTSGLLPDYYSMGTGIPSQR